MIRVDIDVTDATALLETGAYGAGAVIRLERGSVEGGPFVEVTTVLLVAGTDEYHTWDPLGTSTTWYRTRVSKAVPSVAGDYSAYSPAFLTDAIPSLVSVGQMRGFVETPLSDTDLQLLIDIAESEVTARIGPVGQATEYIDGMTNKLVLSRPALSVTSIVESDSTPTSVTLAANDYVLRSPYVIERLRTGTNAAILWNYRVSVTYTPVDDLLLRQGVVIDLVRLTLTRNPGLTSQQIGDWSESYSPYTEYDSEREAILCRLDPGPKMRIV